MAMEKGSRVPTIEALVELYSYKVRDLESGKRPLGGDTSVYKLRHYLLAQKLPGALRVEFGRADQAFIRLNSSTANAVANNPAAESTPIPEADWSYTLHQSDKPSLAAEAAILEEFRERVYWLQAQQSIADLIPQWVVGDRTELRLAYSLTQNFNAFQKTFQGNSELNLAHFSVIHPIPPLNDSLSSLGDPEVALRIVMDLMRLAFQLWRGTKGAKIAPERVVDFLKRFLSAIVEDPDAIGAYISMGPLSVQAIEKAIGEAASLPPNDREAVLKVLQGKLRVARSRERQASNVVNEERKIHRQGAERLIAQISAWLPVPVGEHPWPKINPKILGSDNPDYRLDSVSPNSDEITVKLLPLQLELKNTKIRIQVGGGQVHLSTVEEQVLFIESAPARLTSGAYEVLAFRSGSYAHIRLGPRQSLDLLGQLALGHAIAHLVSSSEDFGYIRLMRAVTASRSGGADLSAYGSQSAVQHGYARASLQELSAFAGRGFMALWQVFSEEPAALRSVGEIGMEMGLIQKSRTLETLIRDAIDRQVVPDGELIVGADGTGRASIAGLSFEFEVGPEVTVVSSGSEGREMKNYLVWPTPNLKVVFAQEGRKIVWLVVDSGKSRSKKQG